MCHDHFHHLLIFYGYLLVLFDNFSVKHLKFALKWPISYFQPILAAIFVTIATIKVKIIRDLYTLAIVLINLQEEIGEKQFVYFILIGGPKKAP